MELVRSCFFYVNIILHSYVVYEWGMPLTLALFAATFVICALILRFCKLIASKQF